MKRTMVLLGAILAAFFFLQDGHAHKWLDCGIDALVAFGCAYYFANPLTAQAEACSEEKEWQ